MTDEEHKTECFSWRCLLGREQMRNCTDDKGDCWKGCCPHSVLVPVGETTRHWEARVSHEYTERNTP